MEKRYIYNSFAYYMQKCYKRWNLHPSAKGWNLYLSCSVGIFKTHDIVLKNTLIECIANIIESIMEKSKVINIAYSLSKLKRYFNPELSLSLSLFKKCFTKKVVILRHVTFLLTQWYVNN